MAQSDVHPDSELRRSTDRPAVAWDVDCAIESTFLYVPLCNAAKLGIFLYTTDPLEIGTPVALRFLPRHAQQPFVVTGKVQWVNPVRALASNRNPGMGITLLGITPAEREHLVEVIHTIAYLRDGSN
jgi:Tfp pilus assembly protein PilZ